MTKKNDRDDIENIVSQIIRGAFGAEPSSGQVEFVLRSDDDEDDLDMFQALIDKCEGHRAAEHVRSIRSGPVYCNHHEAHRDGVIAHVLAGKLARDVRSAAREAGVSDDLRAICLLAYDGKAPDYTAAFMDVESAKRLVNVLGEVIAAAEAYDHGDE